MYRWGSRLACRLPKCLGTAQFRARGLGLNHMPRSFSTLRREPWELPPQRPSLPPSELIDEETLPFYNPKCYYPAKPGEVLDNRYQLLVKVGYGTTSTIWFARDLRGDPDEPERIMTIKITVSNSSDHEREAEELIRDADPSNEANWLLRTHDESFVVTGPEGKHSCLAYDPLREPFWLFQRRFENGVIPLPLVKIYIKIMLEGLDYLHRCCKVAHTDLATANIMITFEDAAVLVDFLNNKIEQTMQWKVNPETSQPVYRRENQFGQLRGKLSSCLPRWVDFGAADILVEENILGITPIQANYYRAPEVILGCGWRMEADIWAFGALLWDITQEGTQLFQQAQDKQRNYTANAHLAEMIALLGPPPREMIAKYRAWRGKKWPEPLGYGDGRLFESNDEIFGGPFFDDDGRFLFEELIPNRTLKDAIPASVPEKEHEEFLSFVRSMLAWLPRDRKTARELMDHPFLD